MANKIIEVEPLIIAFYVDDSKASFKDTKVVDNFEKYIDFMYGDPNILNVKSVRGKVNEYLTMALDYTTKLEV